MKLIQPLFSGSIDVIGDIHGELAALNRLIDQLGYTDEGEHPEGRRLVFIGDLVDRGPNSVGVVSWVQKLIQNGVAQCVAGNHEFNILRTNKGQHTSQMRHGNHWYFGSKEALDEDNPNYIHPQVQATIQDRAQIHELFLSLPLILEDENYRMVHACCNDESYQMLHDYDQFKVAPTENESERHILHAYHYFAQDVSQRIAHIKDKMTQALTRQNGNPVKLCTSGPEEPAQQPYYMKGKERITKRHHWWKSYTGQHQIIFGHYWRKLPASLGIGVERFTPRREQTAPDPFKETPYDKWLGRSMCIDYSVGGRYFDRQQRIEEGHSGKSLCALRITRIKHELGQHELWFDTGQRLTPN